MFCHHSFASFGSSETLVPVGDHATRAGGRAMELDQATQLRGAVGEVLAVDGGLANERQADILFFCIHRLGGDDLRV